MGDRHHHRRGAAVLTGPLQVGEPVLRDPLVAAEGVFIAPFDRYRRRIGRWRVLDGHLTAMWNPGEIIGEVMYLGIWDGDRECRPLSMNSGPMPFVATGATSYAITVNPDHLPPAFPRWDEVSE